MQTFNDLNDLVWNSQKARLLLTAVELDVFTVVGRGATAATVANTCQADPRATEMLLNALVAEGWLEKDGATFAVGDIASRYLLAGAPEDGRPALRHHAALWPAWSQLTDCVRRGEKARGCERDESGNRDFIGAMHVYAAEQAGAFVEAIDLTGVDTLLDLGGGSGAYAIGFCQRHPRLAATVFDRPEILPITRDYVAAAGLAERIKLMPGDMVADALGGPYDLVWVSNAVHAYGPAKIKLIFANVHASLRPGGTMVLRDFIMDESKTTPAFAALFALNMLVATGEGGSYSLGEYSQWLVEAGFATSRMQAVAHAGNTRLLVAGKA